MQTATQALTLTVDAALVVTTTSLPHAVQNQPYSQTLQATGGTTPYTWSVLSGSLPAGITLSPSGVLSGTPTTSGAFYFVAQVQDSGA